MNWLPNVFPNALRGVARPCLVGTMWFGQELNVCIVPPLLTCRLGDTSFKRTQNSADPPEKVQRGMGCPMRSEIIIKTCAIDVSR